MKIQDFRKYCSDETIQVTSHALLRLRERNITIAHIESCIMHGEIIEEYPDDSPFSLALISESRIGKPFACGCRPRKSRDMDYYSILS